MLWKHVFHVCDSMTSSKKWAYFVLHAKNWYHQEMKPQFLVVFLEWFLPNFCVNNRKWQSSSLKIEILWQKQIFFLFNLISTKMQPWSTEIRKFSPFAAESNIRFCVSQAGIPHTCQGWRISPAGESTWFWVKMERVFIILNLANFWSWWNEVSNCGCVWHICGTRKLLKAET